MEKDNIKLFKPKRKISIKKIVIISILLLIVVGVIVLYNFLPPFQEFSDKYIFRKEVSQSDVQAISINSEEYNSVCAFDRYIVIMKKSSIEGYTSGTRKAFSVDVTINNPIFDSEGRFLLVAEKNGQKVCIISNENILWQKSLEGEITGVSINKNGYSAIILKQASYKSVIIVLDPDGKELFTTYLASTFAIDVNISNDNKYLAIAEVNSNGSTSKSNIKIISIEKAKNLPLESVVNTFESEAGELITGIKYQDKNKLVSMYNDKINLIHNNENNTIYELSDSNISFADIQLNGSIVIAKDISSGLFSAQTELKIIDIDNNKEIIYSLDNVAKSLYTKNNIIAINMGTEVRFLNSMGWLIRRYTSRQEIKDILLFNNAAGIIYRDKIEIVNL